MKQTILIASNGLGEDRTAALVAFELKKLIRESGSGLEVTGASLIGSGLDYSQMDIPLIYSSVMPPSGGFPTQSIKGFFQDIVSGALGNVGRFMNALKAKAPDVRMCLVFGDVTLLFLVRSALKDIPIVFCALAKSDHIQPHFLIEEWYIKKNAIAVFNRDELTASNLKKHGINASFLGNPIMDNLAPDYTRLPKGLEKPIIGLLPGSRAEAYDNLILIADVCEKIAGLKKASFIAAIPSSLEYKILKKTAEKAGWKTPPNANPPLLEKGKCRIILATGVFPEILGASDVIIGLAGTANEQAAGLGKPVVAFIGSGPQTTKQRFIDQQKLLGGAMKFVQDYPYGVAGEVVMLLENDKERKRRGALGIARMGKSGACKRIAEWVMKHSALR